MTRKIQLTVSNAILISIAVLMMLGIVGIKSYRNGAKTRSVAPPPRSRLSGPKDTDTLEVGAELTALREELRGLKGPVQDLMDALDELAAEAPQTMPFTRLQYHKSIDRSKTILVVVAGTNPNNCRELINSAFDKATNKFQIRFGLVEVTDEDAQPPVAGADRDVVFHLSKCVDPKYALCNQSKFCPTDFIRIRQVPKQELGRLDKGESWLKHIGSQMYRREEYVLFLDPSAAVFEEGWDNKLIDDYLTRQAAANGRVVLSGRIPDSSVAHFSKVCVSHLDKDNLPVLATTNRLKSDTSRADNSQALATTEFLFAEGVAFFVNTPLDRHLDKISAAAHDVLLSARLKGAGFSIFLPSQPIVFYRSAVESPVLPLLNREATSTSAASLSSESSTQRFYNALLQPTLIKDSRFRVQGDAADFLGLAGLSLAGGKLTLSTESSVEARCTL